MLRRKIQSSLMSYDDRHAAVVADHQVIGVVRIDPDRVHVVVDHLRGVVSIWSAAVDRHVQPHAAHVDAFGSFGSMRTWLKYIGRGFSAFTLRHDAPPSSVR